MLKGRHSRNLTSIANLIGERGEMAKQPLPRFILGVSAKPEQVGTRSRIVTLSAVRMYQRPNEGEGSACSCRKES